MPRRRTSDDRNLPRASRCRLRPDVSGGPHRPLCADRRHRHRRRHVRRGAPSGPSSRSSPPSRPERVPDLASAWSTASSSNPAGTSSSTASLGGELRYVFFCRWRRPFENGAAPAASKADLDAMPGGSETILLVEDDPRLRRVVSRRLRSLGYQVIEADNGANALSCSRLIPKSLMIFTDFVMPGGMNGNELAEAALAARPDIKVLFTSGYAEPAAARRTASRRSLAQEALYGDRARGQNSRCAGRAGRLGARAA